MSPKGASTVKLTKYEHACVVLEKDGATFVIDPGVFSPNAADIIAGADAVLLTHEHADHVHEGALSAALAARPELPVYAPAAMAGMFSAHAGQFTPVAAGDEFTIGDFTISVHGSRPRGHPPGHPHDRERRIPDRRVRVPPGRRVLRARGERDDAAAADQRPVDEAR